MQAVKWLSLGLSVLVLTRKETRVDEALGAALSRFASRLQKCHVRVGMPGALWSLLNSWHGFLVTCVGKLKHELLVLSRVKKGDGGFLDDSFYRRNSLRLCDRSYSCNFLLPLIMRFRVKSS